MARHTLNPLLARALWRLTLSSCPSNQAACLLGPAISPSVKIEKLTKEQEIISERSETKMSTIQKIKRTGRVLGRATQTLLGFAVLLGLGLLAVEWLTGRDVQDALRFPEVVILPFGQAIGLLLLAGLILFCILRIEDRLYEIETELMSIDSTLQDIQPLVEEGRAIREIQADREADQYMSQKANAEEPR